MHLRCMSNYMRIGRHIIGVWKIHDYSRMMHASNDAETYLMHTNNDAETYLMHTSNNAETNLMHTNNDAYAMYAHEHR